MPPSNWCVMAHSIRFFIVRSAILFFCVFSGAAFSQNISAVKEAQTISGAPLTELEVGQEFRYRIVWSCAFVGVAPPEGCGDFF